jgi:hypothetical protein
MTIPRVAPLTASEHITLLHPKGNDAVAIAPQVTQKSSRGVISKEAAADIDTTQRARLLTTVQLEA